MAFTANSQIEAGTMIAGGSASLNRSTNSNSNTPHSRLTLSPRFGYTIFNNFVGGTSFQISKRSNYLGWGLTPFVRYYVKSFYAQVGFGYWQTEFSNNYKSEGSTLNFELGYAAFLTKNVALEPAFYYNRSYNGGDYHSANYGLKIGLQFYFNRK